MSAVSTSRVTVEEYLALERKAEFRSEFFRGVITPMPASSSDHSLISASTCCALHDRDDRSLWRALTCNMRVKCPSGLYCYPDASIAFGPFLTEDEHQDTWLNPHAIFEIFSPASEGYDRGAKFENYTTIPSLCEYVLISQTKPLVDHFLRDGFQHRWRLNSHRKLSDTIRLPTLGFEFPLAALYDQVEWSSANPVAATIAEGDF